MSDTPKTVFKGVFIPAEIWESDLSWVQKCLWATVSSLGRKDSPCFASNEWLAERMETTPESVAKMISRLRAGGYIEDVGFDGRKRSILAVIPSESVNSALTPESTLSNPKSQSKPSFYIVESTVENKEGPQAVLPIGVKVSEKPKRTGVFVRPTLEEVQAFAEFKGLPRSDGSAFFYAKEGNGWKGVKDWKATFTAWKLQGYHPSQKAGRANGRQDMELANG